MKTLFNSPNGQLSSARVMAAYCLVAATACLWLAPDAVGEWLTAAVALSASATAQHYTQKTR